MLETYVVVSVLELYLVLCNTLKFFTQPPEAV